MLFLFLACSLSASKIRTKDVLWLRNKIEESNSSYERDMLIRELALRRDPQAIPHLCRYALSQDKELSHDAMNALVAYGGKSEGRDETYVTLLSSSDGFLRRKAVEGILQRIQVFGDIPYFSAALERIIRVDNNWQTRLHAVEILEWSKETDHLLLDVAKGDANTMVRARAVAALGTRKSVMVRRDLYRISKTDLDEVVRKEAEQSLKKIGGRVEEVVLAVMPFDIAAEHQRLEEGFRSYLSGRLGSSNLAKVVERGQVQTVVDELIFQDNHINDGKAVEIGKALRAEQVVTGTIQVVHGQVIITVKRIDVRTQQIISASESSGSFVDFDQIQRAAANTFIEGF